MTEDDLRQMIEAAFADTPSPGANFDDISATEWDEGIVDYFRGTTWRGHRTLDLRHHSAALSFFTEKAFRYWLPAFMLADLEDPAEADIIAEHIAHSFLPSEYGRPNERLEQFTSSELEAIAAFMDHCSSTSNKIPGIPDTFEQAATVIRARLK
jgi:hypothetical protein